MTNGAVTVRWCHIVGAGLWVLAFGMVIIGFGLDRPIAGNTGLATSAVAASWTIVAAMRLHTARLMAAVGRASQAQGPRSLRDD